MHCSQWRRAGTTSHPLRAVQPGAPGAALGTDGRQAIPAPYRSGRPRPERLRLPRAHRRSSCLNANNMLICRGRIDLPLPAIAAAAARSARCRRWRFPMPCRGRWGAGPHVLDPATLENAGPRKFRSVRAPAYCSEAQPLLSQPGHRDRCRVSSCAPLRLRSIRSRRCQTPPHPRRSGARERFPRAHSITCSTRICRA